MGTSSYPYFVISWFLHSFLYSYIDWIFLLCLGRKAYGRKQVFWMLLVCKLVNVWRLLLSNVAYASFIILCLWLSGGFVTCDVLGTQQMLPKSSVIQSHEFTSSFLILSVHFLEIFNEWFFIHGHALRSRQLFTGTSVALITGISAALRGSHAFIPPLSKRQT